MTCWSPAIPAHSEQPGHNPDDRLCPSPQPLIPSWCLCARLSGWFGRSLITESHARNTPAVPQGAIQWYSHVSHQTPVALDISQGDRLYTSSQFARFAKAGADDSTEWNVPGLWCCEHSPRRFVRPQPNAPTRTGRQVGLFGQFCYVVVNSPLHAFPVPLPGRDGDLRDRRSSLGCEPQWLTYTCSAAKVRETRWCGQIDSPKHQCPRTLQYRMGGGQHQRVWLLSNCSWSDRQHSSQLSVTSRIQASLP